MSNILFIWSCISLFIGAILLAIGVSTLMLGEKQERKIAKITLLMMIPFFVISFVLSHYHNIESAKEMKIKEKNATYYQVTKETEKKIATYCEEKHQKMSTQQSCKRTAYSSLKRGEKYEIFEPSNVITKPSGVEPN